MFMNIEEIMEECVKCNASDILLVPGSPVSFQVNGFLRTYIEFIPDDEVAALVKEVYRKASRDVENLMSGKKDDDFIVQLNEKVRFRVNAFRTLGNPAAVLRCVQDNMLETISQSIPEKIIKYSELSSGLILISGSPGSGKTTTAAAMLEHNNRNHKKHIITLEDPVEYRMKADKCVISQRDIYTDVADYETAIASCLRERPNIIFIGELRGQKATEAALKAAESGMLVIATLHTKGATDTLSRILQNFPANHAESVSMQLANTLRVIIYQKLIDRIGEHGTVVFETVENITAISNLIRDRKIRQLKNVQHSNPDLLPCSMEAKLLYAYRDGKFSREVVTEYADPEYRSWSETQMKVIDMLRNSGKADEYRIGQA
ncbi:MULTISPECIES: type IV pilus twitching motility protein PilT [Clostridia]|uniref:type IV pilus twitching motility protein PilT n=1 Tax=Clostridia TaxID=186801 RepID=UPI000E4F8F70|nr:MULTISPECIES: ATPase, T2SS/T4P/T4SS family [Clostridia]RHV71015.1 hypothetical protein DXB15_03655 [Roseburia sp. OM02-15]